METIQAQGNGLTIEVKRLYLPIKFGINCPKCDHELSRDLSDDYLSYPKLNSPEKMHFYCQECESESEMDVTLKISLDIDKSTLKLTKR